MNNPKAITRVCLLRSPENVSCFSSVFHGRERDGLAAGLTNTTEIVEEEKRSNRFFICGFKKRLVAKGRGDESNEGKEYVSIHKDERLKDCSRQSRKGMSGNEEGNVMSAKEEAM